MTSDPSPQPLPVTIRRHSTAVYPPMAVLAGMQLDVFTPLKDGPLGAEALADVLGVDSRRLRRLLYALVNAELLTVENGRFANTPEAERFLVRGQPAYMGGMHELWSDLWSATLRTAESVRTGKPQAKHDFEAMTEAELGAFLRGLHPGALAAGRALAPALGLERYRTLLDVGGGSGGTAIGACEVVPHLRATVVDLPAVAPLTRRFVGEAGMSGRIDVEAADLVKEPPRGSFEVAILRNLIQTMSVERARRTTRNVGEAVAPGGLIAIVGWVLDDTRLAPASAVDLNLVFLNLYDDGEAYTASEHREWLEAAGFVDFRWGEAPPGVGAAGMALVTARRR